MRILIDTKTGAIMGAGKDLVTGYTPVADRQRGVVLSQTPSTGGKPRRRRQDDTTHDPERPGGLLNGRTT